MTNSKKTNFGYKLIAIVISIITLAQVLTAKGFDDPFFTPDPPPPPVDSPDLKFPLNDDKNIDPSGGPSRKSLDLDDPANYKRDVEYDPEDNSFRIREKVGDGDIRTPLFLESEDYLKYRANQDETDYWRQRLDALSMFNQKVKLPTLYKEGIFDRLFGGQGISIKPQGNMELSFGGNWQNMENPNLTQRSQKYGIFDFDMKMNLNLVAQIGDKLKLNISNNTQPVFGEQNIQKLDYTGKEDEIIKKLEAGNVSFPLRSNLLTGPLSLFGLKAQLQFGRLMVTGVLSQQKSQRRTISLQGGAQTQTFEVKVDDYEENRNFLLGQHFYENYETALKNLPVINSQVMLNKVEVWVTNRTGAVENVRTVINFMDLGEKSPYLPALNSASNSLPDNRANRLFQMLLQNSGTRSQNTATRALLGMGLEQGRDFEPATMRKLTPNEYSFHPQLGFITLNTQVNSDDVVGVAYSYTYNGTVYKVGEFAEDLPPDTSNVKVMFLKMLKGTSARPQLPIWKLMMKNVYSIGGNISREDFRLNIIYQDPGGGEKRYLPEGPEAGVPLLTLLNLDRLNAQGDPIPDGVFDYVEGITINSMMGKVIFPQLEPFGNNLKPAFGGDPRLERRYLFQMLYDSTKTVAKQFQQNNRFLIKGNYKGGSLNGGSEISLGAISVPQGSVSVTAGGQRLTEGVDYQVDYSRGSVKILNQGIMNSGLPINISYEDNAAYGFVQQNFWGTRFDYFVNEKLSLGSTIMRLTERPFTQKVLFGDDPIKNTVLGFDANYQSEFPWLTRMADLLPIYSTAAPSLISLTGEVAGIFPGHQRFINAIDPEGSVFVDDFEGANSSIDLRFPSNSWTLSSAPVGAKNANNQELFPEAKNTGDLTSGFNRAKLAWYMLEPTLIDGTYSTPDNVSADTSLQDYWRTVQQTEVFSQKDRDPSQNLLSTFDLTYFPDERGPYNFSTSDIGQDGSLMFPKRRWGGIQKALDNNSSDFEAINVEYVTFWMLDPFIYNDTTTGGDLYFNLGNVSEDVLKDSRMSFENGIPFPRAIDKMDETPWGYVPRFQQQITRSFDNDPAARKVQDVGYDELDDDQERSKFAPFLSSMSALLGPNSDAYQKLFDDPSSDNFRHFRSNYYDQFKGRKGEALLRYKDFNNPHGNSPIADQNAQYTNSGTTLPESEDINRDNTLNESEAYYQYRIRIAHRNDPQMEVGRNNIVDKKTVSVKLPNGRYQAETWYQFKIPIRNYDNVVGGISDFRSIRFIRMFMSDFSDKMVTLRFAQLQLDRSQWRRYFYSLNSPGENIPEEDLQQTTFALTNVSLEQNYDKEPVPYRMPPGVERQVQPGAGAFGGGAQSFQQDEQSLSLQVCGLKDGDARAVFKEQSLKDWRQYKYLRMFMHAESVPGQPRLRDGDVVGFIRIGSDFTNNYYEYQVPLKITQDGTRISEEIWPKENNVDLLMSELVSVKSQREKENRPTFLPYTKLDEKGHKIVIVGNPNLGDVKNVMLGVLNPKKTYDNPDDDGQRKCVEVWFDELRMAGMDEKPGYAASGQANIQIADLGTVRLGGSMHTVGYGNIDQKVDQRFRDDFYAYDASTNMNMGKLLPKSLGLQLPVYLGYTQTLSNPKYDPYDKDVILGDRLAMALSDQQKDSIRKAAQEFTSVTSFNLSNIRFNPEKKGGGVVMPWSLRNFDLTYSYNRGFKRNPLLEKDELIDQRLTIGYSYSIKGLTIEPFKKKIKSKSKWLTAIKDFNLNLLPSSFTFRNDLHRMVGETQVRNIDGGPYAIPSTFYKNFTWDRNYTLVWDLTKSLSLNYSGNNQSRIDEPYGWIDTKEKRDSLLNGIKRLGRNTYFSQSLNLSYTLPTSKIPLLDWTRVSASYASTYNWTVASRLAESQGNIIANTQSKQLNMELTFSQLYNKSRWLKAINAPQQRKKKPQAAFSTEGSDDSKSMNLNSLNGSKGVLGGAVADKKASAQKNPQSTLPPRPKKRKLDKNNILGKDTLSAKEIKEVWKKAKKDERVRFRKELAAWKAKRRNIVPEISDGVKAAGRVLTMVKRVSLNYTETGGTVLPGFMDSAQILGSNTRSSNWYDFAFGAQPDRAWLDRQAAMQRISRDELFNGQVQQTYMQNYTLSTRLEPVQEMNLTLTWNKQFSKSYSETFKYVDDEYHHFNPYSMGTFSITYIGLNTLFEPSRPNELSASYYRFLEGRAMVSRRLGDINPYTAGQKDPIDGDYSKGYTRYSQEVLIPAFLAAYTGRDPSKIPLMESGNQDIRSNPFKHYLPMPNWKLDYNGLSKVPFFSEYVNNLTISHSYTGTMSMNSFVSSLYFQDILLAGFPSFIDSTSNNYVPFFQVPNVTITESFGPLIGFDAALKNGVSLSFKFIKTRMLSLSLVDYQISESKGTEISIGGGARLKGLNLPFTVFGTNRLKNDITISMLMSYKDDIVTNNYLAQNESKPTRGQKVITISPTVDYIINNNLKLRLYFDRSQRIPVTTASYPITTTRAGITLQFLFDQQ